jgi:hypothetical protein
MAGQDLSTTGALFNFSGHHLKSKCQIVLSGVGSSLIWVLVKVDVILQEWHDSVMIASMSIAMLGKIWLR